MCFRNVKIYLIFLLSAPILLLMNPLKAVSQVVRRPDIAELSCNGLGSPVTKKDLINRAAQLGIPNVGNMVETKFEEFALRSMGIPKYRGEPYTSLLRAALTNSKRVAVMPDSVGDLEYIPIIIVNGKPVPQPPVVYAESSFYDAKAVGDRIRLKSSSYQTLGFLDALRSSRAAISPTPPSRLPPPRLNFLTVASTILRTFFRTAPKGFQGLRLQD